MTGRRLQTRLADLDLDAEHATAELVHQPRSGDITGPARSETQTPSSGSRTPRSPGHWLPGLLAGPPVCMGSNHVRVHRRYSNLTEVLAGLRALDELTC